MKTDLKFESVLNKFYKIPSKWQLLPAIYAAHCVMPSMSCVFRVKVYVCVCVCVDVCMYVLVYDVKKNNAMYIKWNFIAVKRWVWMHVLKKPSIKTWCDHRLIFLTTLSCRSTLWCTAIPTRAFSPPTSTNVSLTDFPPPMNDVIQSCATMQWLALSCV